MGGGFSMGAVYRSAPGQPVEDIEISAGGIRRNTGELKRQLRVTIEEKLKYHRHQILVDLGVEPW